MKFKLFVLVLLACTTLLCFRKIKKVKNNFRSKDILENELKDGSKINEGMNAVIWKYYYKKEHVAVKINKKNVSMENEAEIFGQLSRFCGKFVPRYFGKTTIKGKEAIVMELLQNYDKFYDATPTKKLFAPYFWNSNIQEKDEIKNNEMFLQNLSEAFNCFINTNIFVDDINFGNILVNKAGDVKIIDFGMTTTNKNNYISVSFNVAEQLKNRYHETSLIYKTLDKYSTLLARMLKPGRNFLYVANLNTEDLYQDKVGKPFPPYPEPSDIEILKEILNDQFKKPNLGSIRIMSRASYFSYNLDSSTQTFFQDKVGYPIPEYPDERDLGILNKILKEEKKPDIDSLKEQAEKKS